MLFLNIFLLPSFLIILSLIIYQWIAREELFDLIKVSASGLIIGILLSIIYSILDNFFTYSANYLSIFFKILIFNGIIFTIIFSISIYFIFKFIIASNSNLNWFFTSLIIFYFLCSIFIVFNITKILINESFNYPIEHLNFISFLIFTSIITGICTTNFFDSYETIKKISWGGLVILLFLIINSIYFYIDFFNFIFKYSFILLFLISAIIFERTDFRYRRKR